MKRNLTIAVLVVAVLWLMGAAVLLAQPPEGQRMPMDPNKNTGGEIKKIDAKAMTFEVERTNRQSGDVSKDTVYCTDKTTFKKDGNDAKFADFKEGDRIRAMGERKNGKFMADQVMTGGGRRPPSGN